MKARPSRTTSAAIPQFRRTSAFSLVELLAVIAIISILLALIAPALEGFGSTAGRKGAVNILMNTMEQARVAALEQGRNVHIVFWRRQFPERDAIMVVRERASDDPTPGYELLTRWIKMPEGVLLHNNRTTNILSTAATTTQIDASKLPGNAQPSDLSVLTFNGFGGVAYPSGNLMLFVADGVRGTDGGEAITQKDSGIFEIISLRRFTGRASLEVSAI